MNPAPLAIKAVDYIVAFAGALALTFILTPIVREMNRRFGMVDRPDSRRINKVPIPRGGGLALFLGVMVSYSIFALATGRPPLQGDGVSADTFWKLSAIAAGVVALGDETAHAAARLDEPAELELAVSLRDRVRVHVQLGGDVADGRDPVAGRECAGEDLPRDELDDLPVDGHAR